MGSFCAGEYFHDDWTSVRCGSDCDCRRFHLGLVGVGRVFLSVFGRAVPCRRRFAHDLPLVESLLGAACYGPQMVSVYLTKRYEAGLTKDEVKSFVRELSDALLLPLDCLLLHSKDFWADVKGTSRSLVCDTVLLTALGRLESVFATLLGWEDAAFTLFSNCYWTLKFTRDPGSHGYKVPTILKEERVKAYKLVADIPDACDWCGFRRQYSDLKRCGRCRVAHCCSEKCQKAAWTTGGHKTRCRDAWLDSSEYGDRWS